MAKRVFDLILSFLGLLILFPLFIIIAIAIKRDSSGPVFYKGERIGRFGKPFMMYKFRTMAADADKGGASSTAEDDPRLTAVGSFLRRYKLDELPQLINIAKGEMSFVGPRPQVAWAVALYSEEEKKILTVRPGITDYASIKFSNEGEILKGSADPDKTYMKKIHPEKMKLGLQYAQNHSVWTDIKIILKTFKAIITRSNL